MSNPLPEHTSYSQLSLYEHCPRCYYLSYAVKVPSHPSEPLIFGSAVHEAIEYWHKFKKVKPGIKDRRVYMALEVYTQRFKPSYLDQVERGVYFDFRHPDTAQPLPKQFKLFIDGIKLGYNRSMIIEHKTANAYWTLSRVHEQYQATLYSAVFRALYGFEENAIQYNVIKKPRDNIGVNYDLQVLFTRRDRSDYANFWHWAYEILTKIEQERFEPSEHRGWKCDRCKVCCL